MITEKKLNIEDTNIHYILAGDESNPPFIFLHGWPGCTQKNRVVIEELLKDFYVIAPEHPGLLRSDPLKKYINIFEQYADIIYQILVQENLSKSKCIVLGQSFGGSIAGAFAEKYKQNTKALILTDSVMGGQKQDLFRKILFKHGKKIITFHLYLPNFMKKNGLKWAFSIDKNKENKKETNKVIRKHIGMIDDYCSRSYKAMKTEINLLDKNYEKNLPIIMLWGDKDGEEFNLDGHSKAKDAEKLYEKFKKEGRKVEFLVVPGGHTVLYDKTKDTLDKIKAVLNKYI